MAASNGTSGDQSWRTNLLRQNVRNKIEEAIRVSGNPTSKTAFEMENHIFLKARTKEDYLSFVARLILHVKEMGSRNATVGTDCQSLPNSLKRSLSPTLSLMLPMPCPPLQHPFPQPLPPMNATPPAPTPTARVWTGIMDYEEKPLQPGPSTDDPRDTHSLDCNITCRTVNGVPEVYGHEWPQQLLLSLVPKQLIMSLFPMLKSSAYHITLHFADDQHPGLSKLIAIMSSNWIGCIQLAGLSIRMIIVLYNPDKRIFMGFVPHNQQEFFDTMKEIVEDHKKRKNDPTMSPTIMPSIDPEVVSNRSREMDARSSQVFDEEFVNEIKNEMKAEIMREIKSGIMSEFAVKLKNEIKCELKTELLLEIESEVKYKKIKTESNCDDSMHSNDFLALDYL